MGVQKTPGCMTGILCDILTYLEDHILISKSLFDLFQAHLAPGAYWRDTYNEFYFEQYLKYSDFLPLINNERQHEKSQQYKDRFSSLNRLELVKFQNDTTLYPIDTSHFGTINVGSTDVVPMEETEVYKNDTIGLKTMFEAGKVYMREIYNRDHCQFSDLDILEDFLPFLYEKDWAPGKIGK